MKPIKLPIVNVDHTNRTALVKSQKTTFPVHMTKDFDCMAGDDAIVTKSAVTGEWLMIDYSFNNAFNYAVHNSMQTNIDDMITDEDGVPYEF